MYARCARSDRVLEGEDAGELNDGAALLLELGDKEGILVRWWPKVVVKQTSNSRRVTSSEFSCDLAQTLWHADVCPWLLCAVRAFYSQGHRCYAVDALLWPHSPWYKSVIPLCVGLHAIYTPAALGV